MTDREAEPTVARIDLPPPPDLPDAEGPGSVLANAIPMLGSLGSLALVAGLTDASGGRGPLAAGGLAVATVAFLVVQIARQRAQHRRRVEAGRRSYAARLAGARATAQRHAEEHHRRGVLRHPGPGSLHVGAAGSELEATDTLEVRVGEAWQRWPLRLVPPGQGPGPRTDPACAAALERLVDAFERPRVMPLVMNLRPGAMIEIRGPTEAGRALARAMICDAVARTGARQMAVAVATGVQQLPAWDWVKWLPHAAVDPEEGAPRPMVATSATGVAQWLRRQGRPQTLLVIDHADPTGPTLDVETLSPAITLLLREDHDDALHLAARDGTFTSRLSFGEPGGTNSLRVTDRADQCGIPTAAALARSLAAGVGTPDAQDHRQQEPGGLEQLLSLDLTERLDPPLREPEDPDRLRVPIGTDRSGDAVHLDLKEAALGGVGPHGLVVGATGSGKSELLRTLVVGLALTHSPAGLNLVLVDFKGGATFSGLGRLPHASAVITNLSDDLSLVDRMYDAIMGELTRRQVVLREVGNLASVHELDRLRRRQPDLPRLPSLLIIIDEFSELLLARPGLADLLAAVGRLGRSLGLHLLLASQRLEEGRLRGLESHLSYRIALRTFSAAESRAVLGVPDAHTLGPEPGLGLFRAGPQTLVPFCAAYVSGPRKSRTRPTIVPPVAPFRALTDDNGAPATTGREPSDAARGEPGGASLLDEVVERLAGTGPRAHRVWLPPLARAETLAELMPDLAREADRGLLSRRWRAAGPLVVPLGTVDRPREQRRDPLVVDLRGAGGHLAIVGRPRSGTSLLLTTLVCSLALTTTPYESGVFLLDLGGALKGLEPLPHVRARAAREDPDLVRAVVAEVSALLEARHRVASAALDPVAQPRLFLVVDGWEALRSEHPDLEAEIQAIAARGLAQGVHVVIAARRWIDVRPALRDLIGTRLELRLGDPADSLLDRRAAVLVPTNAPGRGLVDPGLHMLTALPVLDSGGPTTTIPTRLAELVDRVRSAWPGPAPTRLRPLPERVEQAEVRRDAARHGVSGILLGLGQHASQPVAWAPTDEPHLRVFGGKGSGKTAALRTVLSEIVRTHSPDQAQIVLVDCRRTLLGEVPDSHLCHYLATAGQVGEALAEVAAALGRRQPGPDVSPHEVRSRAWWTGADCFVVIDDYELLTPAAGSLLGALSPLLPQAGDIGLHLILARGAAGASRLGHDPALNALADLGAATLLLPGLPDLGPWTGAQRAGPGHPGRARTRHPLRGAAAAGGVDPTCRGSRIGNAAST